MPRRAIILLIIIGALVGAAALLAWFLDTAASPERIELLWEDPPLHLAVTFRDRLSGQATWLTVTDGAQTTRKLLDDDCPLSNVTLVRYEGWLLVLSGPYVLGAYHRPSRRLLGEHEWDQLPFTVRSASGTVLANGRFPRALNSDTPAQFPLKPDPLTKPGTPAP